MSDKSRNQYAVMLSLQEIAEWVTQHKQIVIEPYHGRGEAESRPFPPETRFARGYYDAETNCLVLLYEHPTFPRDSVGRTALRVRVVDRGEV